MKSSIVKIILTLISGIVIGTILLVISYLFPTKVIQKNINKSIGTFIKEEKYESVIYNYRNNRLDNFTDAIMLQNASYTGKDSIISKAMNVYRFENDADPCQSLILQMQGQKNNKITYYRYWHGYLIFLKPLLMIFSYGDLRVINSIIQPLVILGVILLLIKRNKKNFVLPYFISVLLISPMAIIKSLQYSTIFYLFNFSMIIMLLFNDKFKKQKIYPYFFLVLGMLTSYFDFLTYPLVTLGMSLVLYMVLNPYDKVFDAIKGIINKSVTWGIGYIGMWLGKIAIGSILLNENMFALTIDKVSERTSMEAVGNSITIFSVIKRNLSMFINKPYFALFLVILVYIIYKIIKTKYKPSKKDFMSFIPYFIISLMPFAWYVVASNHSYIHSWFTYRVMIITIFSLLSYVTTIVPSLGGKK